MKAFFAAAAFGLSALTACSNTVIVTDPVTNANYIKNEELYAARNGSIRVEVMGDTFGMAPEAFADLVVNEMRASYYRHDFFTRQASRATDPRYKIVMMFNADPAWSSYDLCAASQPIPAAPRQAGQRSVLFATFCGGPMPLSENSGRVALAGTQDPNFAKLVDQVTGTLFTKTDNRDTSRGGPGI